MHDEFIHFHRQGKVGSIISTVRLSGMLSDSSDQPAARVWKIPLPRIPVTTRIIIFLVGDPYKPSFASVTGRGTTQDLFGQGVFFEIDFLSVVLEPLEFRTGSWRGVDSLLPPMCGLAHQQQMHLGLGLAIYQFNSFVTWYSIYLLFFRLQLGKNSPLCKGKIYRS